VADDAGIAAAWWRGLEPPAVATVSDWAETFRVWAGRTTAAAGRYRLDRVPYLREPMDALGERSGVQRVVVMKAARLGFTEGLVTNLVGYAMHQAPGPILVVVPTRDIAVRLARESIEPMCESTPEVAVRLGKKRGTGARHATLHKEFPRGSLTIVGARSAAALRQTSARYLLIDELDGCERNVQGEGSPVAIAEARARTYGLQRKVVLISSPTEHGRSLIESEFLATDQRHFLVPCVHCGHRQHLVVEQLTWTSGAPETATYTCVACRAPLVEGDKPALLAGGAWVATATRSRPRTRGYHLSALYSPSEWCTWADVAREAEAAAADVARDRVYRNTFLGESIVERHDVPDWQRLRERQTSDPLGRVPAGALFLTAGIDVQRDRLEFHLWGWGRDRRRWLVDVRVCDGDIETDAPWTALRALLDRTWPTVAGDHQVPLSRAALDTRFRPARCQAFAKTCPPGTVDLVEGMARLTGGALVGHYRHAEAGEPSRRRTTTRRQRTGLLVWPINTGS
jgi:phage terminase large subunit GpA-like protein